MAIVINGSGTITGISVGGLPDAIVDSGTLATNSVDSAELIDGAIDDSHMASGVGGKVVQVKRLILANDTNSDNTVDYATGGSLNGTLDSSGIWRWKNGETEYLTIPNFSATSGNMLVAWWGSGGNNGASASAYSLGVEFGDAAKREFDNKGYNNNDYSNTGTCNVSHLLTGNLSNANIHAIIRIEETNKTHHYRNNRHGTSSTNWGSSGASAESVQHHLVVMEIEV